MNEEHKIRKWSSNITSLIMFLCVIQCHHQIVKFFGIVEWCGIVVMVENMLMWLNGKTYGGSS